MGYRGEQFSLDVKAVNFDAKKKEVAKDLSDSDDESFEEEELESNMNDLVKKKKDVKKEKKEENKAKYDKTNVNIFKVSMGSLATEVPTFTGDPILCKHCGVIMNSHSKLLKKLPVNDGPELSKLLIAPPIHPVIEELTSNQIELDDDDEISIWKCEFCDGVNKLDISEEEIPNAECMDYVLAPAPADNKEANNIIFCIGMSHLYFLFF